MSTQSAFTAEQLQGVARLLGEGWDVMRVQFVLKNTPGDILLAILQAVSRGPDYVDVVMALMNCKRGEELRAVVTVIDRMQAK